MGKQSAPPPPDYRGAAEETARGNRENLEYQTRANRPNQFSPWGSTTWVEGPGGRWTQTTNVDPELQQALDSQIGLQRGRSQLGESLMGRAQREFGDEVDWGNFRPFGAPLDSSSRYYDEAGDALYDRATSRLDPRFEQEEESLTARLYNQGLRPGDEAYDNAMDSFNRRRTDAYTQAGYAADIGAGQEASRMFGMDERSSRYATQLRQQEISEELQRRGWTLNEINALISGQQVGMPSMPGFAQAGYTPGADYTGAARDQYGASMDAFNIDQANRQALFGGLGDLATFAFGF